MKILCVHQGADLYGSDRSFAMSVSILRERFPSAEISVVLPRTGKLAPLLEPFIDNFQVADVGAMQRSDLRKPLSASSRLFLSAIRAWKNIQEYDVVYLNTIVVFSYMIASIFSKKIIINHVREIPGRRECGIFSVLFWLSKSNLIFNSQYTMKSFPFLIRGRSNIVLNGVRRPPTIPSQSVGSTFNVLLIGRINAWKGQMLALEAIRILAASNPNIRLRIVGGAPSQQGFYVTNLLAKIKSYNLEKFVQYYPFQSDPSEHFVWSNISLVPSTRPEPFGRVAIESMAFGRPVIASDHGGPVEIIVDDFGGFLFKNNSVDDLVSKISMLAHDKVLLSKKSFEAVKCFESRFSESVYIDQFSSTFNKILNQCG